MNRIQNVYILQKSKNYTVQFSFIKKIQKFLFLFILTIGGMRIPITRRYIYFIEVNFHFKRLKRNNFLNVQQQ